MIDDCDVVTGSHEWHEIAPAAGGTWTDVPGGASGTLAYEVNGNVIGAGRRVWMEDGAVGETVFIHCCEFPCE